ncbi:MAG: VWA domain-containing protein [Candidatus Melainabacteria bacterium]|nr:VWA domain-containing protein [Candidatus Melainabacteria bacterium]
MNEEERKLFKRSNAAGGGDLASATPPLARWRLVLGKYAKPKMPSVLNSDQQRMSDALELLYSREYKGRGVRQDARMGPGSLDPSQLNVTKWLDEVKELFPKSTCEKITKHALERYGMVDLINDAETLKNMEPSTDLLCAVLSLKGQMKGSVLAEARRLIARVVEEIKRKLMADVRNAISGRVNRFSHSAYKTARNFDARDTIRRNLKNWDPERRQLVVSEPRFFQRVTRHIPWEVIICIDQSGSMVNSVIHSAVMAGILAALHMVQVKLVIFDTSIVDLSDHASDPVEVLMSVQLGGGTNIGAAVRYCEQLVSQPTRTVLVLVTDFCEGGDPRNLIGAVRRLRESGVKLIGLASLDMECTAWYDEKLAGRLAAEGMEIAALTPVELANWLSEVMHRSGS